MATVTSTPCCSRLTADVLDEADAQVLAQTFAALGDPVRLRLLSIVAAGGADEVCACDLPALVERSQPTVSHHMKLLVDAGLVQRDKRGQWVWYRISPTKLADLRRLLA